MFGSGNGAPFAAAAAGLDIVALLLFLNPPIPAAAHPSDRIDKKRKLQILLEGSQKYREFVVFKVQTSIEIVKPTL